MKRRRLIKSNLNCTGKGKGKDKGKSILFDVGDQTGKDYLLTLADVVKSH